MGTSLFSEQHEALRDVVRRWVERDVGARAAEWERDGAWPREAFQAVLAQGWPATAAAESAGGDRLAALVVWEELGRLRSAGVVHDLLAQAHAAGLLAQLGAPEAEAALAGELAVALVGGADMTLRGDGDATMLSGRADAVPNTGWADAVVAVAREDEHLAIVLVPTDTAGCVVDPVPNPFGRRAGHGADVELRQVNVAPVQVLSRGPDAGAVLLDVQARFRLDHAAATVAGAWLTWEDAKEYALQREAFGRPIGRFQVNRHALAEMASDLTAATALVRDTTRRYLRGELAPGETASVRLYVDRLTTRVTDRCLQLHGGYGYTTEFDVQRAWRDARHLAQDEAAHDGLREEIAAALEGKIR